MVNGNSSRPLTPSQRRFHQIIFEADTRGGKLFDVTLIVMILASVLVVILDSVTAIHERFAHALFLLEWGFTLAFTLEYLLRLYCIGRPLRYAVSFFGIVDLLAIIPTYLSFFFAGSQYLLVIRLLRVLRIFRVLKFVKFVGEADILMRAFRTGRRKIIVFVFVVMTLCVILGSLMYLIEGPEHGYTSIPKGIYWAIVTLTTVGYGDLAPQTNIGQAIASIVMILGYGIIAVPTGIVTVEMSNAMRYGVSTQSCPQCSVGSHMPDAKYCRICGAEMEPS
jgi:voltage-gated potassium channel